MKAPITNYLLICTTFCILWAASGCNATLATEEDAPLSARKSDSLHSGSVGGLVSTRFRNLQELSEVVQIEFQGDTASEKGSDAVRLVHFSNNKVVVSELEQGVSEDDFRSARDDGFWAKLGLACRTPYALIHRQDIMRVFVLSRRKHDVFGPGDVAFYDFAELMTQHIRGEDASKLSAEDLTEKGFLNTFNHITAQAFVTTLFSEELADYVADVHERHNMAALISGKFTKSQLENPENNPMDNYVDMINNEWGQELGKGLKQQFEIDSKTVWTPELLAGYLNEVQAYYTWAFQISFIPFDASDEEVIRFAGKLNTVLNEQMKLVAGAD
ncbi:MAG: hypothetical protein RLP15_02740 [Cryomorphaceae bacterium]